MKEDSFVIKVPQRPIRATGMTLTWSRFIADCFVVECDIP